MGRSVSYPSGAIVAFTHFEQDAECHYCDGHGYNEQQDESGEGMEHIECSECDGTGTITGMDYEWTEELDDYRERIKEMFPSFDKCDYWLDREDHAIAENRFAYFGISEYCGLVAIWLVAKEADWAKPDSWERLRDRWLDQVEAKFLKAFGQLRKVATASNGEAFFERIEA